MRKWCPACDKMSGHVRERCPKRPLRDRFVELPRAVQNELGARLEQAEEALRDARFRKHARKKP